VGAFITELMDRQQDRMSLQRIINMQARNALISDLQDSLRELTETLQRIDHSGEGVPLATNLCEGLHALLGTLVDANDSGDEEDLALLQLLTADRTDLMDRMRHRLLREGSALPFPAQEALFGATSLFERTVWLMRRYTALRKMGTHEKGS
jgi:phosphate:Na+ symporter